MHALCPYLGDGGMFLAALMISIQVFDSERRSPQFVEMHTKGKLEKLRKIDTTYCLPTIHIPFHPSVSI
jgi:hypothetical protein